MPELEDEEDEDSEESEESDKEEVREVEADADSESIEDAKDFTSWKKYSRRHKYYTYSISIRIHTYTFLKNITFMYSNALKLLITDKQSQE